MKIRTVNHPLGTGLSSVSVAAPVIDLRVWESVTLVLRGWSDRARNRRVPDSNHTHFLHGLESQCQRGELDVRRAHAAAQTSLRSQIAANEVVLARADEALVAMPSTDDLKDGNVSDRRAWLIRTRESRELNARASAARAAQESATSAHALLVNELDCIQSETAEVSAMWSAAYRKRAAVYTRARCGWRGLRPGEAPAVPAYRHARAADG